MHSKNPMNIINQWSDNQSSRISEVLLYYIISGAVPTHRDGSIVGVEQQLSQ